MKRAKQKVNIIGGISFPGRIAILSDKLQSIATWGTMDGKEVVLSIVKPLPVLQLTRPTLKRRWIPIPRVLRLFIFIYIASNWWVRAFFILLIVAEVIRFLTPIPETVETVMVSPLIVGLIYGFWIILIGLMIRLIALTRAWHGAEHMTIETYRSSGSSSLREIKKRSPVHPRCGGRLLAPILLVAFLSPILAIALGLPNILIALIGLEMVLWIDDLIGWYRIPIFAQLSRLLQRYLTTKVPSKRELLTAQVALKELLKAHEAA
ncbi:DUF1385 domain-containing protein [Patescibacteria group bacterium]|nr:DUF1385 domain-containing protein [Patescibacteria group bacterium]